MTMNVADLERMLTLPRRKTLELLTAIEAMPNPPAVLAWRPGPGRAHVAWQLMHVAATDDRHLNVRMRGGEAKEPEFVRRFAGGSTPDEEVPSVAAVRAYLTTQREAMLAHLRALTEADLDRKPNEQAPWTYREWVEVLAWHESHHHGQAHLTLNLYKGAQG